MTRPVVVWDPRMLGYHHPGGEHPMDPLRWELTWQLAGALGVIDGFQVIEPERADAETLGMVHTLGCAAIAALLRAGVRKVGYADVDAHHGDCVQTAFYADPRVMTVSVHETPLASVPGHRLPPPSPEDRARRTALRSTPRLATNRGCRKAARPDGAPRRRCSMHPTGTRRV